jgi:hypothetical protein
MYKEKSLFVLYALLPCKSQCNQTWHGILFRPGEVRELLFDPKILPPGYKSGVEFDWLIY